MIKRQYGMPVKVDEINKVLGQEMYKYIQDNNIQMLGEPLPAENQEPQDLEKEAPYTFVFDIAVAPEFTCELTGKDKIDYYNIEADDKLIDQQVENYAARTGEYVDADEFDSEKRDMLKGDLRELDADGNAKEDGIVVSEAVMMPQYIKVEDQKKLFDKAKAGSVITFNPKKAYPESEYEIASLLKIDREKVADINSDFTFLVTEISRFEPHAVNQELFDQIFGEGTVKDEKEFRGKIASQLEEQFVKDSDFKFLMDVRKYCEDKIGPQTYPEALLKRVMLNNNKDKDAEYVEKNFEGSIKELNWHLIKEQLVKAQGIKVEDADVRAAAKEAAAMQFAQYGMNNVPDEYLDNYADDMLKQKGAVESFVDRAVDMKLTEALKKTVKLNEKKITWDKFNEMMSK